MIIVWKVMVFFFFFFFFFFVFFVVVTTIATKVNLIMDGAHVLGSIY
jgi:hypothetical protein